MTEVTDEELAQLPIDDSTTSRVLARLRRVEALLKVTTLSLARSQAEVLEQKARVEKAVAEMTTFKEKAASREVEAVELRADVAAAERYSRILNNSIETKNNINATLRVELTAANKSYAELKSNLEMHKDQWKRSWEARKLELEEEQARWFHNHLNDEVTDVKDAAKATYARLEKQLHTVLKQCSEAHKPQDSLVAIGLTVSHALSELRDER